MPKHHHQARAQASRSKLDAADLRGSDDVASHADNEQVSQALVEDDLGWDTRIRTSENNRERLLTYGQLLAARLTGERVAAPIARYKSTVALPEAFKGFARWNHRCFILFKFTAYEYTIAAVDAKPCSNRKRRAARGPGMFASVYRRARRRTAAWSCWPLRNRTRTR
jgi:hypothetical protein